MFMIYLSFQDVDHVIRKVVLKYPAEPSCCFSHILAVGSSRGLVGVTALNLDHENAVTEVSLIILIV